MFRAQKWAHDYPIQKIFRYPQSFSSRDISWQKIFLFLFFISSSIELVTSNTKYICKYLMSSPKWNEPISCVSNSVRGYSFYFFVGIELIFSYLVPICRITNTYSKRISDCICQLSVSHKMNNHLRMFVRYFNLTPGKRLINLSQQIGTDRTSPFKLWILKVGYLLTT